MLNIAIITAELPFPANSGGRIYTWERIKELNNQGNNIFLYTFKEYEEKVNEKELLKYCNSINIYSRNKNICKFIFNLHKPFSAYSRFNLSLKEDIDKDIRIKRIELLIVDMPQLTYNIPENIGIPIICSQHNVEYKTFINVAQNTNNLIKKISYLFEGIKLKYYEKNKYLKSIYNGYTFISDKDLEFFTSKYGEKKSLLVPMGYNIQNVEKKLEKNIIVFTGKMNYQPNVEGVRWFCKNVFPLIKETIKDCEFYIVGKDPTEEVKVLDKIDGINVTGEVNDINQYLDMAKLVVIPLLSGGGVKIKLLEALGRKNIVVSTTKGVEGTEFINEQHLIIADEKNLFAKKCIDILLDYNKYINLTSNAIKLIQSNYSWSIIGEKYNKFLLNEVSKR